MDGPERTGASPDSVASRRSPSGVLAVVVAHASSPYLSETLAALEAQTHPVDVTVVAVGDVSFPGRPPGNVVSVSASAGFAEAAMAGIRASAGAHDWILLVHDDAAPEPVAVSAMLEHAATLGPEVAAVGAKLVEWDDPDVLLEVGGALDRFGGKRSGLDPGEVDHGQHDGTQDVLFCSAACLLVRKEALNEVGGLDPASWPLYDDVDLCWRLRRAGRRVVVAPQARVRHAQALSRGVRRAAGRGFGPVGMLLHTERGRLWFMLKNYGPLSLALLLPQFAVFQAIRVAGGLVRREFWRLRTVVSAWLAIGRSAPAIMAGRRSPGPRTVEDQALLRLGARRAVAERRYERVALAERLYDWVGGRVAGLGTRVRDPITWAGALALLAVLITLRDVVNAGSFTLGELRPFAPLGRAWDAYLARPAPEGLDPWAPAGPGILVLGVLRSVVRSAAAAEKILLLAALAVAGVGAARVASVLGVGRTGRRWFAILAMVNPVTLTLVREGFVGALVTWAGSMWIAAVILAPPPADRRRERFRQAGRWAIAWALAVALHPPAVVWLTVLSLTLTAARHGDGLTSRRLLHVAGGAGGAFVATLPWSLSWFSFPTPIAGSFGGLLTDMSNVSGATLGAGLPLIAWTAVALGSAYVVGASRSTVALTALAAVSWLAGAGGAVPYATALVGVGWCTLALLAFVARRVSDEVSSYAFGFRQVLVVVIVGALAVSWTAGVVRSVIVGTEARTVTVVPTSDAQTGRVLWLSTTGAGTLAWATQGFREEALAFPSPSGEELSLVVDSLRAAGSGRTHRLGALLALGNISHVVALQPSAGSGLGDQADLAPIEEQSGATVYRNDAWGGPVLHLRAPPEDVLAPAGLSDLVRQVTPAGGVRRSGPGFVFRPPGGEEGVVYVAGGARRGWTIGGERARAGAAGAWVPVSELPDEGRLEVEPPPGRRRLLYPVQAIAVLSLLLFWGAGTYLATPDASKRSVVELIAPGLPRAAALVPLMVLALALFIGWTGRPVAADAPFLSSAWYCPPVGLGSTGEGFVQRLGIVNPTEGPATFLVRTGLEAAPVRTGTLAPRERATVEVDSAAGAVVEAYGRRVAVAAVVTKNSRKATSLCASGPRAHNLFAEGGRAALKSRPTLFEAYVLHNPFTDLARASIRFISPNEVIAPPRLRDIRVPPGESVLVDPGEQFEPQLDLSTEVTVWQGRAVVARRLCVSPLCRAGGAVEVAWSLPTPVSERGTFPRATTLNATTTLIAVNPGEDSARVELDLVTTEGSVPDVTFDVPARSRASFEVDAAAPDAGPIQSGYRSNVPVAIESLVVPSGRRNLSLLPPLQPGRRWAVPVAEGRRLIVGNPGTDAVRIEVIRLGEGPAIRPITIEPSRVASVPIEGRGSFGLLVQAEGGDVTVAVVGGGGAAPGARLG